MHNDDGGTEICDSCYGDYSLCIHCSTWTNRSTDCGDPCCSDCYDEYESPSGAYINNYEHKPSPNFLPKRIPKTLYMGVELETDNYDDTGGASDALHDLSNDEQLFYQKEDSSLGNGIEIVSHPATLDFHRTQFPWTRIAGTVGKHGGKSQDAGTCGLHIHFNKDFFGQQEEEVDTCTLRLLYLVERFWEQLVVFSRRSPEDMAAWSARYHQVFRGMPLKGFTEQKYNQGNHMAVNITPEYTIEIRLFNGTLKVSSLLAAIELVHLLAYTAKDYNTERLYNFTWGRLIQRAGKKKYPNLYNYLIDRKLAGKERVRLPEDKDNLEDISCSNFQRAARAYGRPPERAERPTVSIFEPERPAPQAYSTAIPEGGHFIDLTRTGNNIDGHVDATPIYRNSDDRPCDCNTCTRFRPILDNPYQPPNRIRMNIDEWHRVTTELHMGLSDWQVYDINWDSNTATFEIVRRPE